MPYDPNIQTSRRIDPGTNAANSMIQLLTGFGQNMATLSNNRERNAIDSRRADAEMVEAEGRAAHNSSIAAMNNASAAERQFQIERKQLEIEGYQMAGPMVARQITDHTEKMKVYMATDKGGDAYLAQSEFIRRLSPTTFNEDASDEENLAAFLKSETYLYNKDVKEAYNSMVAELPKIAIRVRGEDGVFSHVTMNDVKLAYRGGDNSFLQSVFDQTTEGNRQKMAKWLGTRVTDNGFLNKTEALQMDAWDREADHLKVDRNEYAQGETKRLEEIDVLQKQYETRGLETREAKKLATETWETKQGMAVAKARELKSIRDQHPFFSEEQAKTVQEARRLASRDMAQLTLLEAQEEIDRQSVDVFRTKMESGEITNSEGRKLTREEIDRATKAHSAQLEIKRHGGVGDMTHNVKTIASMQKTHRDIVESRRKNALDIGRSDADRALESISEVRRLKAAAKYVPKNYDETQQVDNAWYKRGLVDAFARNEIHDTRKWQVDDAVVTLTKLLEKESNLTGQNEPETPKAIDLRSRLNQAVYIRNYLEQKSSKEDHSFIMDSGRAVRKLFNSERWIGESLSKLNDAEKANANSILMKYEEALSLAEGKDVDDKQLARILGQIATDINPYKKEVMEFIEADLAAKEEDLARGIEEMKRKIYMSNPMQIPAAEALNQGVPIINGSMINGSQR